VYVSPVGVHTQIRRTLVKPLALGQKLSGRLRVFEQRPALGIADAPMHVMGTNPQVYHRAQGFEQRSILGERDDAATAGEHQALAAVHVAQKACLQLAKGRLPALFKERGNTHALLAFKISVHIDARKMFPASNPARDAGFAGSHEAYQYQVTLRA
jgi:hypothetical protein